MPQEDSVYISRYEPNLSLAESLELPSTFNHAPYSLNENFDSDLDTGSSTSVRTLSLNNQNISGDCGKQDCSLDTLMPMIFDGCGVVEEKKNPDDKAVSTLESKNCNRFESFSGVYSTSGFDMISVMSKVVTRPNPQIHLGPVDMGCAFVTVDARQYDFPIVYCSHSFEELTGYSSAEVIGRNCRFLQAPDGQVTAGSRRRFTDNNVVTSIKDSIDLAKEIQVSLVNYKKGGQPFMNLITIIPVSLDGDEITHFVGFQADMVDQPHEILQKIKDGIYYPGLTFPPISPLLTNGLKAAMNPFPQDCQIISDKFAASKEVFSIMGAPSNIDEDIAARMWNIVLLDECDDFIHVLSLKGVFLYCSLSCKKILEYTPEELVGTCLSSICEPNDLIPVLRELKEVSSDADLISLVYRIKRKNSGYMWFEANGRIFNDKSRNRKYAILSGRPRPMYSLSREVVETFGGLSENEFWIKLSLDGIILHVTSFCQSSLNIVPDDFEGTSLYQFVRSDKTTALTRALQQAKERITVKLQHSIRNSKGRYIDVVSTFYPSSCENDESVPFILCQSKMVPGDGSSGNSSGSSSAPSLLTNKVASEVDNIFSILGIENRTNWQYELHQLRIANKKLRDELDGLIGFNGRRRKRQGYQERVCSMCFRKESPEWRKGSKGSKTLCNSCGLKYLKATLPE